MIVLPLQDIALYVMLGSMVLTIESNIMANVCESVLFFSAI